MRRARKIGGVVLGLFAALFALGLYLRHPLPQGRPGPDGDALAHAIERAVDTDAWARTLAVRFHTRGRAHLWDRQRNLARVRIAGTEALIDLGTRNGVATRGGHTLAGKDRRDVLDRAYRFWINDTFWLNPLAKLFDEGTERARVDIDGRPGLLVTYTKGGLTPGDRYLWIVDDRDRPIAWRLWVSVLPVGGVELTWEGWMRVATGAWISTVHHAFGRGRGPDAFPIDDLVAGATLAEVEPGPDPFAALFSGD
jgi:hypothetical protein